MSLEADNAGIYALVFELADDITVEVGALGEQTFEAGVYCYVGSAKQHLRQRIERHFRRDKSTHWHIDYLTTHPAYLPRRALLFELDEWTECGLSRHISECDRVSAPVVALGASDCEAGCKTHLWCTEDLTELEALEPSRVEHADR